MTRHEGERQFFSHVLASPVGPLAMLVGHTGALYRLAFGDQVPVPDGCSVERNRYACGAVSLQLEEYFAGERREFTIDCHLEGTAFQRDIWYRLGKIPYGETISYAELARKAGRKDAWRSVATAVGRNPVPLIIPCHRVIRSDGRRGNYALASLPEREGRKIKDFLLDLEAGRA